MKSPIEVSHSGTGWVATRYPNDATLLAAVHEMAWQERHAESEDLGKRPPPLSEVFDGSARLEDAIAHERGEVEAKYQVVTDLRCARDAALMALVGLFRDHALDEAVLKAAPALVEWVDVQLDGTIIGHSLSVLAHVTFTPQSDGGVLIDALTVGGDRACVRTARGAPNAASPTLRAFADLTAQAALRAAASAARALNRTTQSDAQRKGASSDAD